MRKKTYLATADEKLGYALIALLEGATLTDLAEILGSKATARRMISRLEGDTYQCVISQNDRVYKIDFIGDGNIWSMIFDKLMPFKSIASSSD